MIYLKHLVLTPLYPPPRFGGIEKIVQRIAEGLVKLGDTVEVYAFNPRDSFEISNDFISGVLVQRIDYEVNTGSLVSNLLACQDKMIESVIARCRNCDSLTIIHAHDWFVGPAALSLRNQLGVPLLSVFHSDKRSEYKTSLDQDRMKIHQLQKSLAHGSDMIFCYSKFMQSCISESLGILQDRINLFRCGIDEHVSAHPYTSDLGKSFTVLYLGRLAPEKDIGTLVKAFHQVIEYYPQSVLKIVGDGPEQAKLKKMVNDFKLDSHVIFSPFTSSEEQVNAEFLTANVLVLPSTFEPFGLVILEAISRHVPVIVSASGGPIEIIRDGETGWYFKPGDSQELAQRILDCLGNPPRTIAMASAAFEDVCRQFRWDLAVSLVRNACLNLSDIPHKIGLSQ